LYSTTSPSTAFYSTVSGELAATTTGYIARNDDGSNIKYTFSSNVWTAQDKQGNTYVFGPTASSRQDDAGGSGRIFKWMLQSVTDPNGNITTYTYTKDNGQIYPSTITYTNTATTTGIFAVNFYLAARATSTATSSASGFPVKTRYQVSQVGVSINSATTTSYALTYGVGDNLNRATLASITQTGNAASPSITLPVTSFMYSTSTPTMATSTWSSELPTIVSFGTDNGVILADVNGDGLADIVQARQIIGVSTVASTSLNIGLDIASTSAGWVATSTAFVPPCSFVYSPSSHSPGSPSYYDGGGRLVDLNGDGLPDFICSTTAYINNGSNWISSSTWDLPYSVVSSNGTNNIDGGIRFGDINGDGLPDFILATAHWGGFSYVYTEKVYINTGNGWTYDTSWALPTMAFTDDYGDDFGPRMIDINGDGLADLLVSTPGDPIYAYINNGQGWTLDHAWDPPVDITQPQVHMYDINSDGLIDIGQAGSNLFDTENINSLSYTGGTVYLNTGSGWQLNTGIRIPYAFTVSSSDGLQETGTEHGNFSGNGLSDSVTSAGVGHVSYGGLMFKQGSAPDLLTRIVESAGKIITATYKATSAFRSATTSAILNPKLPFYFPAVQQIQNFDGINATSTTSYVYQNGCYYFANTSDRRMAGFGQINTTDASGNVTKTYYDTGVGTATSIGQAIDDQGTIGKIFRIENFDSNNTLYKVNINTWLEYNRSAFAHLVVLGSTTEMDYDGKGTHKDIGIANVYDSSNGNLLTRYLNGEVAAANDGTFSDIGTDKLTTYISYAASTTSNLNLPSRKTTLNFGNGTTTDTKYYYDGLSFGSINKGNLTEQDDLKTGSTYVQTSRTTYNTYGLPTQILNARGATTTNSYDVYNLYPATTTNAVGQTTTAAYNYFLGKPAQITDPNGSITQNIYDALNRVIAIRKPDPVATTTLATTTAYIYNDTSSPRIVQSIEYLNAATSTNKYKFLDGFGRIVEQRNQADGNNTYVVKDTYYDGLGLVATDSLPFFASSTAYTGISNPPAGTLLTIYSHDPLQRVLSTITAIGTTTNTYGNWQVTVTDPNGNLKDYFKDAYGNLVNVIEHVGTSTATTTYAYDGNNNLIKITDALGNVRNFTYDYLSRQLMAEDLHSPSDVTFGTTTFAYDDTSNLTQKIDPKGQTINYTYDGVNRLLTEDYTGQAGTEITNVYDSCLYGKGHLCTVTNLGGASTTYAYDLSGFAATENKKIGSTTFITSYQHDRQGNITNLTYPDNSQVSYIYSGANQVKSVLRKESTDSNFLNVISNFDYSPLGQVANMSYANGARTTNTYDSNALYRLVNRLTTIPVTGTSTGSIALDTTTSARSSSSQTTASITIGSGSNRILIVGTSVQDANHANYPITGITYGGVALTKIRSDEATGNARTELWYLLNPATGTANIIVNATGSIGELAMEAISLTGVDQTTPIDAQAGQTGNGTASSLSITTSANNTWVASMFSGEGTITGVGSGQTELGPLTDQSFENAAASYTGPVNPAGASSQIFTMSSGQAYAQSTVSIKPASGSASSINAQKLAYVYDRNGNITQINDTSDTKTAKTVGYSYDNLNRLFNASTTNASYGGNFNQGFTYDAIGNLLSGPAGMYTYGGNASSSYANPNAVTSILSAGASSTIAVDAVSSGHSSTQSTSVTHVVGNGANRLLLCGTSVQDSNHANYPITGITDGGVALTKIRSDEATGNVRTELWYLQNPATGTSTVTATSTGSIGELALACMSFAGVDQTTPVDTQAGQTGNGIASALFATTTANNAWLTSILSSESTITGVGSGQIEIGPIIDQSFENAAASYKGPFTPAGSNSLSFTMSSGQPYAQSLAALKPAFGSSATTTYAYDKNGNLTSATGFTNSWDWRNRLASSLFGSTTYRYLYDENDERVTAFDGLATTTYPNQYYESTGATTTKHLYANGMLIATLQGSGASSTPFYVHTDNLSSASVITNATGTIVQTLDYYPYGQIRLNDKASFDESRKFIGQIYDGNTQLNYLNARYQDGARGQFLSEDPSHLAVGNSAQLKGLTGQDQQDYLSDPQQLNSYSYVRDNPIIKSDPTGLSGSNPWQAMTYGLPPQASQIVYDSLRIGFGLPAAALVLPGVVFGTAALPELAPIAGTVAQGALVNTALRATNDYQTGNRSTPAQYLGDATIGAATSRLTFGRGILATAGFTAVSSMASNYVLDNKSINIKQVTANVAGATAAQITGNILKSSPAPLSVTFGSFANYAVTTAMSTAAILR
jgi:RHS repeat-associated protein